MDNVVRTAASHTQGVLCFDAWSNVNQEHVINILVKVGYRIYFLSSIACSSDRFDARYMAEHLKKEVEDMGEEEYVCGIISDNTRSCVKAKRLVSEKYPGIIPGIVPLQDIPYAADLLAKDLGAMPTVARVIDGCKNIRTGVYMNQYTLSGFREVFKSTNKSTNKAAGEETAIQIGSVPDTRFGYNVLVLGQVKSSSRAIRAFVESPSFPELVKSSNSESARGKIRDMFNTTESSQFWCDLILVKELYDFLYEFNHYFEKESTRVGELVPYCDWLFERIQAVAAKFPPAAHGSVMEVKRTKLYVPASSVAFIYLSHPWYALSNNL